MEDADKEPLTTGVRGRAPGGAAGAEPRNSYVGVGVFIHLCSYMSALMS